MTNQVFYEQEDTSKQFHPHHKIMSYLFERYDLINYSKDIVEVVFHALINRLYPPDLGRVPHHRC